MPNDKHLAILKQGVEIWNKWRSENRDVRADLIEADLYRADLTEANLGGADLTEANLRGADLSWTNLYRAHLSGAHLYKADLYRADLTEANLERAELTETNLIEADLGGAHLSGTNLSGANLSGTNLSGANLSEANLERAALINTNFTKANLSKCRVFGISAWDLTLQNAIQTDLIITQDDEPVITVDNLEVAQFIYLLLHNEKIREVIDTITSKAVLILGRFASERKAVLDALREELRKRNYTPILFDFEKPSSRDLTETVMTLAGMARFVIADLSDPNSIPHEMMSFAERLLSVPVKAIFCPVPEHKKPYQMYEHLRRYPHVLPIYEYESQEKLIEVLYEKVIQPAEDKVKELRPGS